MSREFVKKGYNSAFLHTATRQQEQIRHFTLSKVQEEVSMEYLRTWAHAKYITNDYFLNFVKSVFKTQNFLSFYKYLRYPIASASLVNDKIKKPLQRVFFAEDSFTKTTRNGKPLNMSDYMDCEALNKKLFNALLFRYNDIIITDLKETNTPFHEIICIDKVVSIESKDGIISKIAYRGKVNEKLGTIYIDSKVYAFYPHIENDESVEDIVIPHDLGKCPAAYVSNEAFDDAETDVVRKSIFSMAREKMEEYVFLKTLQRMTEPNGAIPIVTKLKARDKSKSGDDIKGAEGGKEPMSAFSIGSQRARFGSEVNGETSGSDLQAGSVIAVDMTKKADGSIDMDMVKNWVNFFYTPVEALKYIQERIKEIESDIVVSILGDFSETSEASKNELQVSKSYVSKQDVLRDISVALSRARNEADYNFLGLKFGPSGIYVNNFFGSDFFLETQAEIYEMLTKSPNPIESRGLLSKLAHAKNRFNQDNYQRDKILYQLLPYATVKDFEAAIANFAVGEKTFQQQTRFNYWIDMFEAEYGDILQFWNGIKGTDKEKLMSIDKMLKNLITVNYEQPVNRTPASV